MCLVRISLMVLFVTMVYMKITSAASEGDRRKVWDPNSVESKDLAQQLLKLLQKKLPASPERHLDEVFEAGYNQAKKQYFVTMKVCMPRPIENDESKDGCNGERCEDSVDEKPGCKENCEESSDNKSDCGEEECKNSGGNESGYDEGCPESAEDDNSGCSDSSSCDFGSSKGLRRLSSAFNSMERMKRQSSDEFYCERCSVCASCSKCSSENQLKIKNYKCEAYN